MGSLCAGICPQYLIRKFGTEYSKLLFGIEAHALLTQARVLLQDITLSFTSPPGLPDKPIIKLTRVQAAGFEPGIREMIYVQDKKKRMAQLFTLLARRARMSRIRVCLFIIVRQVQRNYYPPPLWKAV